jgi:5-methyltetrahydropteroyltriglutamate--homocysteine methyltransferase
MIMQRSTERLLTTHTGSLPRPEGVPLPGKVIIPGLIDTTTNYVEHPELVAQRIERFAGLVGRENVVAGTDCGFATFAHALPVDTRIVWRKLATLSEGAALASDRLWK